MATRITYHHYTGDIHSKHISIAHIVCPYMAQRMKLCLPIIIDVVTQQWLRKLFTYILAKAGKSMIEILLFQHDLMLNQIMMQGNFRCN